MSEAPAACRGLFASFVWVTRTCPAPTFGAVEGNRAWRDEHVRVSTAFNKMLGIVGATVASVTFTPTGIVVGLRRRRSKLVCPCGWKTRAIYDRSVRRWRHLDLAGSKLWLEAEIRRLRLPALSGGCAPRWCRGPVPVPATPVTCRTWWRSWRSGWTRRRSPGCCGSAGRRSPASSSTSSPTSSTPPASTACSASVSTRSPTARGIAT